MKFKLAALVAVAIFLTLVAHAQTDVFNDDFETGDFSKWSNGVTGGSCGVGLTAVTNSTTRAHGGTHSLKAVYDNNANPSDRNCRAETWDRIMPGDTGMTVDVDVYHETPLGAGCLTPLGKEVRFIGSDVHFDWFLQPLLGDLGLCNDFRYIIETENSSYGEHPYYFSVSSMPWQVWNTITMYVKYNTTNSGNAGGNGIIEAWLDGVQVLNVTDAVFRNVAVDAVGTNANQTWLGAQSQDNLATMTRYFDNFRVRAGRFPPGVARGEGVKFGSFKGAAGVSIK